MTNESVLQKVIFIIRKERQSIGSQLWEKQKYIGYLSALDFIERRIYDMQKELHNERIDSITVEMQHEIKKAYRRGYENGKEFITDKISLLMDDVDNDPSPNIQEINYFKQTFVKK